MAIDWKPGRGALGVFKPLLGDWRAEAPNPTGNGTMACTRRFQMLWNGSHVQLDACWEMAPGKAYRERALFGRTRDGALAFWSFTSDGKNSQGTACDASDVHAGAIAFEAEMPAGTARFVYWPDRDEGFRFAVESRTKKGWNRFVEHHYRPVAVP
ncbi:hypothetical protein [Sphingomonas sp.]|uniref:hypothetical protein n=1 Tax=Sphingomonas sp. TaxID=28214 RepID=UPI001B2BD86A|nr:hypothetical protein [Sphingomonas sp.]MBO9712555.1 hypothetical protein [Sphingomonas sp.]